MKFELHAHTRENDVVVTKDAAEIVRMYHEIGYEGMVITNHVFDITFEWYGDILNGASHEAVIDHYLRGYRLAKEEGDKRGMVILLGLELRFDGTINDYLVYGIDEEFLYRSPLLNQMDFKSFMAILPDTAVVYQAHPFRDNMSITNPKKLFGVEVFNGGTSHTRNDIADLWADKFNLHKISGSDYHRPEHLGRGGVDFTNRVGNLTELVEELRADRYSLIKT